MDLWGQKLNRYFWEPSETHVKPLFLGTKGALKRQKEDVLTHLGPRAQRILCRCGSSSEGTCATLRAQTRCAAMQGRMNLEMEFAEAARNLHLIRAAEKQLRSLTGKTRPPHCAALMSHVMRHVVANFVTIDGRGPNKNLAGGRMGATADIGGRSGLIGQERPW